MSDNRGSFWGYLWSNKNYKHSRYSRSHNDIYTRNHYNKPRDGSSALKTAQDGWNKMTNYLLHGDSNGS